MALGRGWWHRWAPVRCWCSACLPARWPSPGRFWGQHVVGAGRGGLFCVDFRQGLGGGGGCGAGDCAHGAFALSASARRGHGLVRGAHLGRWLAPGRVSGALQRGAAVDCRCGLQRVDGPPLSTPPARCAEGGTEPGGLHRIGRGCGAGSLQPGARREPCGPGRAVAPGGSCGFPADAGGIALRGHHVEPCRTLWRSACRSKKRGR